METKANYLIVGSFVLALIAGVFVFVVWLANFHVGDQFATYLIDFTGSVTGISEGSGVRYRGVPVGTIGQLRINPDNLEQVEVTINVKPDTPIREDTIASIEILGLAGTAYIQLTGGTEGSPPLLPKQGQRYAVIPSRPSNLEEIAKSVPEALKKLDDVTGRLVLLLDDQNLNNVTSMLDDGAAGLRELRTTLASVQHLADNTQAKENQLTDQITPTLDQLRKAADSIDHASHELDSLVAENRQPLKDFTGQGLSELTRLLAEARVMIASLTRLSEKLQTDPSHFFLGNQQKGVPPP
jgi:phospholipid/cholesterol/gamma-HCH transport system substrate-binding protein